MYKIIYAKVGNSQNSIIKKWAEPTLKSSIFHFQKNIHSHGQRVAKWKIAKIWQSKEQKNNKKSPKNESHKGLQSWPNVLQHPVVSSINYGPTVRSTVTYSDPVMLYLYWPYTPPVTCTYLTWSIILGIMRGMMMVVEGCGWQLNLI